jgi:hypothetical protein
VPAKKTPELMMVSALALKDQQYFPQVTFKKQR